MLLIEVHLRTLTFTIFVGGKPIQTDGLTCLFFDRLTFLFEVFVSLAPLVL